MQKIIEYLIVILYVWACWSMVQCKPKSCYFLFCIHTKKDKLYFSTFQPGNSHWLGSPNKSTTTKYRIYQRYCSCPSVMLECWCCPESISSSDTHNLINCQVFITSITENWERFWYCFIQWINIKIVNMYVFYKIFIAKVGSNVHVYNQHFQFQFLERYFVLNKCSQ